MKERESTGDGVREQIAGDLNLESPAIIFLGFFVKIQEGMKGFYGENCPNCTKRIKS